MYSVRLKVQGLKAQNENRVLVSLAKAPIGGGQPEMTLSVTKDSWLVQSGLGAEARIRIDGGETIAEAKAKAAARFTWAELETLASIVSNSDELSNDARIALKDKIDAMIV